MVEGARLESDFGDGFEHTLHSSYTIPFALGGGTFSFSPRHRRQPIRPVEGRRPMRHTRLAADTHPPGHDRGLPWARASRHPPCARLPAESRFSVDQVSRKCSSRARPQECYAASAGHLAVARADLTRERRRMKEQLFDRGFRGACDTVLTQNHSALSACESMCVSTCRGWSFRCSVGAGAAERAPSAALVVPELLRLPEQNRVSFTLGYPPPDHQRGEHSREGHHRCRAGLKGSRRLAGAMWLQSGDLVSHVLRHLVSSRPGTDEA